MAQSADDDADCVVPFVGDIQIAAAVKGAAVRELQAGAGGGATVTAVLEVDFALRARDRVDMADGLSSCGGHDNFANNAVVGVCDVDVVQSVDAHAGRVEHRSVGGWTGFSAESHGTASCKYRQFPGRIDFIDAAKVVVQDVRVAQRVLAHGRRGGDARAGLSNATRRRATARYCGDVLSVDGNSTKDGNCEGTQRQTRKVLHRFLAFLR